jgi:hypothetical protein
MESAVRCPLHGKNQDWKPNTWKHKVEKNISIFLIGSYSTSQQGSGT